MKPLYIILGNLWLVIDLALFLGGRPQGQYVAFANLGFVDVAMYTVLQVLCFAIAGVNFILAANQSQAESGPPNAADGGRIKVEMLGQG
jgi:hypothetical protein